MTVAPLLDRIGDFADFLATAEDEAAVTAIRRSYSSGRPVGAETWIKALEALTERDLAAARRGPKPKGAATEDHIDLFRTVSP